MLMSLSNGYIRVLLLPMLWISAQVSSPGIHAPSTTIPSIFQFSTLTTNTTTTMMIPASLLSHSTTTSTSHPTTNSSTPPPTTTTTTTTTTMAPTTKLTQPTIGWLNMTAPISWPPYSAMTTNSTTQPTTTTTPTTKLTQPTTQPTTPSTTANTTKPLSSGIQLCPNTTWQLDSNLCFLTVNTSLTWSDASSYCHSLSSKLLIFDNDFIQRTLYLNPTNSSSRSLLGPFVSRVRTGQWVGIHLVQGKLWWEADVPIKVFSDATSDIFIWNGSQPNGQDGGCGMVANFSPIMGQIGTVYPPYNKIVLQLAPCDGKRPFVCFRDPVETVLEPILQLCPPGWNGSVDSDFCYWTNPIPLSFHDAYQSCRALNATLAQPQTSNQNIFTLAAFENSVLINKTLGIQPLYWLGFYSNSNDTMNMTTVEGRPWLGSFNGFRRTSLNDQGRKRRQAPPTEKLLCVYMAMYNFSYVSWLAGDCNTAKPSVCQLPASASGTPVVKLNNFSPSTTIRVQQLSDYTLTCSASNFHPTKQVVWIKDGIYIDNGLPPEGLTLYLGTNRTISQLDIYNTSIRGLLQGYYSCEVWGIGTDRISSNSTLIIFEDVATFRGTIWARSNISSAVLLLNVTFWSRDIFQNLNTSFYNNIFQSVDNFQIQFGELQLSSTCCNLTLNFTVYYPYNINNASLPKLMSYLQTQPSEVGMNSNDDWRWVLNDKIYQALLSSISTKLATPATYFTIQIMPLIQILPSIYDVKLWRTDGCESGTIDFRGATLHFPPAVYGKRMDSVEQCLPPAEPKAVATAQCTGDFMKGGHWNILSGNPCNNKVIGPTSSVTQDLLSMFKGDVNSTNVDDVTSQLSNLTTNSSNLLAIDVILVSHILDNVASVKRIPINASSNFVSTVSNLMNVGDSTLMEAQESRNAPIKLTRSLERMTSNVDLEGLSDFSSLTNPNLAVQVWNMSSGDVNDLGVNRGFGFGYENITNSYRTYSQINDMSSSFDTAIILSPEAIDKGKKLSDLLQETFDYQDSLRASFIIYQKGNLFNNPSYLISSTGEKLIANTSSVNSLVVSGAFNGIPITNLTDRVQIYLWLTQKSSSRQTCAYLDYREDSAIWGWSVDGLWTNSSYDGDSSVVCYSTHLTNFAVLAGFDLAPDTPIARALQVISIIGLAISIAGLTLTILAQILFRKIRKGRSQMVLLHLSLALLAVDIIVLAGVDQTSNYGGCCAVAALLHYFLLVSFLWMLVEAVIQYLKFVKVFDTYTPRFMLKAALPAWLIPAVIVGIVAAVNHNLFRGPEHYCWLAPDAFHFAFLLPLGLIMVTNLVLFILVIKGITCDRAKGLQSNQSKSKMVWLQVQAAIACFVLMGLTWLFAFFAIDGAAIVMQFLFCIFNSLQGFFIFIFLNIREKPVRQAWAKFCCRCCLKPGTALPNKGLLARDVASFDTSTHKKVLGSESESVGSSTTTQTDVMTPSPANSVGDDRFVFDMRDETVIDRTNSYIRESKFSVASA